MISLHRCADLDAILDLKAHYLQSLIAPLDDMWEIGFINAAPHWEIRVDEVRAGYYAANDEGALLQFYVQPDCEDRRQQLFDHVIAQDSVTQAVVSTIDPPYLSLCLDVQKQVKVHTYLYELHAAVRPQHPMADGLDFRLIEAPELDRTVAFQQACLADTTDLSEWLRGYSSNLIARKELFVLCQDDEWLGLGECRKSDSQEGVIDVGMMVTPAHRRKGWATYILTRLSAHSTTQGNRTICSTTVDNIGAQKAITQAGFISHHRIMNVSF